LDQTLSTFVLKKSRLVEKTVATRVDTAYAEKEHDWDAGYYNKLYFTVKDRMYVWNHRTVKIVKDKKVDEYEYVVTLKDGVLTDIVWPELKRFNRVIDRNVIKFYQVVHICYIKDRLHSQN